MSQKILIDKKWLYQKYIIEKKSLREIAKLLVCAKATIYRWLNRYNIKIRSVKESIKDLDRTGKNNAFYNKKHTKLTRSKMSTNHVDVSGRNNPAYTKGLTLKDYFCKDCNTLITPNAGFRGLGRCNSCANKCENLSEETRKKMSDNHADFSGEKNGRFGLEVTKETRRKMSLSSGGTGIPFEHSEYGADFDNALKEQVRFRDNYKCKICDCTQIENGKQLDVHHIDYDKLNCILNNLVALCRSCHMKTNYNRKYWMEYFSDKSKKFPIK